ncbi:hypothetical protein FJZ53_06425 [Candidatus Woesearchaeota archaeon]|nr:hypothetical protein [Candidatus Woesearchaeota archaeon]
MKLAAYALILILSVSIALASDTETGKVYVTVINDPPEIVNLQTSEPYEGEPLRCEPTIKDETESAKADYKWYKNSVLIQGEESSVLNPELFDRGDVITCEVTPNDLVQDGETKSVSVTITPKPFFSSITGAVVGIAGESSLLSSFLFLAFLALLTLSVVYFLKKR